MASRLAIITTRISRASSRSLSGQWGGVLLAWLLPGLIYRRTLAPTIYGLDSAELTNAAYGLGLAHPPGYPLYLLLGHLFTYLPYGDVGYRLNLMSAFFGALAIAALFLLLLKLTRRPGLSLAAALLLAYSFYFWSAAVMAEVYTLHLCLMGGLLLSALTWQERQTAKWLSLTALLFGLGLANHLSTLLLAPGLLYWVLTPRGGQRLRPGHSLPALAAFGLGLSCYLYLPLRHAAQLPTLGAMPIRLASWRDILAFIAARPFWDLVFAYSWFDLLAQLGNYLYHLWGNFLSLGLAIGLVGGIITFQQRRNLFNGLFLMYLANTLFFIGYRTADKAIMFLPTYFIWAVWLGLGYHWLCEQAPHLTPSDRHAKTGQRVLAGLFLALALAALVINFPHADLSDDRRTYERANRIFAHIEPNAYILAMAWFEVAPLEYLHLVEERRPDVSVLNAGRMPPADLGALIEIELERDTHPIYSTAEPDWLANQYRLDYLAPCDCYQIKRRLP